MDGDTTTNGVPAETGPTVAATAGPRRRRAVAGRAATGGDWQPDRAELEEVVRSLEVMYRPSASEGEHQAAEWIAARLREIGCTVAIDEETAHGGYWWPIGLMSAAAVAAGALALRGRRFLGALIGGMVVAGIAAAHGGLVFNPAPQRALARRFPERVERANKGAPLWYPVIGGPALVAAGSLLKIKGLTRLGMLLSAGTVANMIDIGRRPAVPGANDNLSAVAVLVALARSLRQRPVKGLRVLLVSMGSEETLQEGILAFARRHFHELPIAGTRFIVIDTVGSPRLVMVEAEGVLKIRPNDPALSDLIADSAAELEVPLVRGQVARASTDAVVPNKAGYRTALMVSFDKDKVLSNYHQPTDIADNLDFTTVANCARVTDAVIRKLAV